jgi:hypothetical protein
MGIDARPAPSDRRALLAAIGAGRGAAKTRREDFRALVDKAKLAVELPNIGPALIQSYPGLAWVKKYRPDSRDYVAILLSEVYVQTLLGPKVLSYLGKTDAEFWPPEIALAFWQGDEEARIKGEVWVEEKFASPLTGAARIFRGFKWRFTLTGDLYVAGAGRGAID